MLKNNIKLFAHDPIASADFEKQFFPNEKNIKFVKQWKDVLSIVNLIIIVTTWSEYKDLQHLSKSRHIIVDSRRMLDQNKLSFKSYKSIGYSFD